MPNLIINLVSLSAKILPALIKKALYRNERIAALIRRSINRVAPTGLTDVIVAAGGLEGLTLLLDLTTEKDYWLGTYEVELQSAIREFVKPGWVAYDLGANIGYITLLLALSVGSDGRVFAFEPLPANVERLRANIALNDMDSFISVHQNAVGKVSGPLRFLLGPSGATGRTVGSHGSQIMIEEESIDVAGISIDDFIYCGNNQAPQVLKIDIEGGEIFALPGMQRLLNEKKPLLFIELHGPEAIRITWETLVRHGYRIHLMSKGFPLVQSLKTLHKKAYVIALPN